MAALFKLRLASLVVFSAALGYLMGVESINFKVLTALSIGGFLLTGGSNGLNQAWERRWDALMERTRNRPIPAGRLGYIEASIYSSAAAVLGILILWIFVNQAAGILGLFAFFLYVFIYTPLKRVSSFAVFVGAIPGAVPPMLGYIGATADYGLEAGLLFAVQMIWQFPHFWSIAWILDEDYKRGGYRLLPFDDGHSSRNAFQIFLYSLFLIPVSLLPWALPLHHPMVGIWAAAVCVLCGGAMAWFSWKLLRSRSSKDARRVMFASFFYLPIVQIAYVLDKLTPF